MEDIIVYTSSSSSSDDDCPKKKKNAIDNMVRLYHSLAATAFDALKIAFKIRSSTFREEANKFKDVFDSIRNQINGKIEEEHLSVTEKSSTLLQRVSRYRKRVDEMISLAIRYEITTGFQSLYIKLDGELDGIDDSVVQERISRVQDDFAHEWENIMFPPADDGSDHPQESAFSSSKD